MAVVPMARSGAATVVRPGVTRSAVRMLSKPTTLTSPGTRAQSCASPRMSPMASRSFLVAPGIPRVVRTIGEKRGFNPAW